MSIEFNQTMNTSFNYSTLINKTNVDIYIKPAMGREDAKDFQIENLNLTWNVTSFKNATLQIKLYFYSTLEISPLKIQDTIVFHVK